MFDALMASDLGKGCSFEVSPSVILMSRPALMKGHCLLAWLYHALKPPKCDHIMFSSVIPY